MSLSALTNPFELYKVQPCKSKGHRKMRSEEKDDYITLSTRAIDFNNCLTAIKSISDIDEDKIKRVEGELLGRDYQISAEELSDKFLNLIFS